MKSIVEGQLSKYTNVVKGWQYRWFILNPETGFLDYFVVEGDRRQAKSRGCVHLAGAVISPSEEDSQTFSVNSASGDIYKLRAANAKERQFWINKLRAVSERHTQAIAISNAPLTPRKNRHSVAHPSVPKEHYPSLAVLDAFGSVRQVLQQVNQQQQSLVHAIECLPSSDSPVTCTDSEILLLKATSQATLSCLEQCLAILQITQCPLPESMGGFSQNECAISKNFYEAHPGCQENNRSLSSPLRSDAIVGSNKKDNNCIDQSLAHPNEAIDPYDEETDDEILQERDLENIEEHKPLILALLSQLKLGMDLTRVVLPTFILEKRSLLEMFSDFMGHTDLFIRISDEPTPEKRMLAVLKWYLTSFHLGRHGSIAKKPYNPILGEIFRCSWRVNSGISASDGDKNTFVRYIGEQVSHHPPVSAFFTECPDKNMYLTAHAGTRSKFMGMSVAVNMIGEASLHLRGHNEVYNLSYPSAYAKSVISIPWVELAGKVTVQCPQTGYSANIIFHPKPFYGGKLHYVTGEVKSPSPSPTTPGTVFCRISGYWNSCLEFIFSDDIRETVDVHPLNVVRKRVLPSDRQTRNESREVWFHVTESLKQGNLALATEYKKCLEDNQRREEKLRYEQNLQFVPSYFSKHEEGWSYNKQPC